MKILKNAKERSEADRSILRQSVGSIIENVIKNGDDALIEYNNKFDGCNRSNLRISKQEIAEAYEKVNPNDIEDIKSAAANIKAFAKAQKETIGELKDFSPAKGIFLGHKAIPVDCLMPPRSR